MDNRISSDRTSSTSRDRTSNDESFENARTGRFSSASGATAGDGMRGSARSWTDGASARPSPSSPFRRLKRSIPEAAEANDRDSGRTPNLARESRWSRRDALTVADVMTSKVRTMEPEGSVRDAAQIMRQEDVGIVPIVEPDGKLWGLVTDRDIVVRGLAGDQPIDECRTKDVATTDIDVVNREDSLADVIDLMGRQQIRRVPVVDAQDHLVGIVALADIAQHAAYHQDLQIALEKISGRRAWINV